ncbi:MAG TPA: superoxide dismutase family protein, partial [Gemmatimonadales bacterium]|nr:superoxide dismutase family protein [Gemmatimonadales bacterium]
MNRCLAFALLLLPACAVSMGPPTTKAEALPVAMFDATGRRIGTATLTADSAGLAIALEVAGLAPGPHAVHIHEHGLCERPDFLSAGPHLDEGGHQHGRLN